MSQPISQLRAYFDLIRWDWVREMKRKETIVTMVLFALVTLVIFSIAIKSVAGTVGGSGESGAALAAKVQTVEKAGAGILWVTFFLAGTIGIDHAFRPGARDRVLEGLLLSPVSRTTLYYARVTSTTLYVVVMEAIAFVAFCVLYSVDVGVPAVAKIAAGTVAATLGFVAAGITLSAMTRSIRGGDVMLRLLLFPLLIPLFYVVVGFTWTVFNAERLELQGLPSAVGTEQIVILAAYDLVYLAAGQLLFDAVVADFDS